MTERVLELLSPAAQLPGAVIVDATLGLGGHSERLLAKFPQLQLVGIDRDPEALQRARSRLAPHHDRIYYAHATFDHIDSVLAQQSIAEVAGVLFDFGVSSMQLDLPQRGFAYAQDAPLDMRMDPGDTQTAADLLNTASVAELTHILRTYGEERFAAAIAKRIVAERDKEPWSHSARLVELLREVIPARFQRSGGHPAKRTFQALRIAVNNELELVERAVKTAIDVLMPAGRIVAMSYHSLEDRIIKTTFRHAAVPQVPDGLPVVPAEFQPWLRLLTRGAETASAAEIASNPRAASVRVRAAEKLRRIS